MNIFLEYCLPFYISLASPLSSWFLFTEEKYLLPREKKKTVVEIRKFQRLSLFLRQIFKNCSQAASSITSKQGGIAQQWNTCVLTPSQLWSSFLYITG